MYVKRQHLCVLHIELYTRLCPTPFFFSDGDLDAINACATVCATLCSRWPFWPTLLNPFVVLMCVAQTGVDHRAFNRHVLALRRVAAEGCGIPYSQWRRRTAGVCSRCLLRRVALHVPNLALTSTWSNAMAPESNCQPLNTRIHRRRDTFGPKLYICARPCPERTLLVACLVQVL